MTTPQYRDLLKASDEVGERRDCTVRAIALATNSSYNEVRCSLKARGRRNRSAAYNHQWLGALVDLGWTYADILPLTNGKVKTVITAKKWLSMHTVASTTVLISMTGHVAAWKYGRIHDGEYSGNSRKRIDSLYLIHKREHKERSFQLEE